MLKKWYARIKYLCKQQNRQQNRQQYITLCSGVITECIGITISNLAIWFIPQTIEYSYDSILDITKLEWYIIGLIIINLISWFWFIVVMIFELFRELWLIRTFDYSRKYSSVHLTKYKSDYPEIFHLLEWYNTIYYKFYLITKWICIINNLYSWIVIIYFRYASYKTITALFTNSWICYSKVSKGLQIGKDCKTQGIGYSYHNTQNLSFNRIDARIKKHISNSNISAGGSGALSVPVSRLHSRRGSGNISLNASWNSRTINFSSEMQDIPDIPGVPGVLAGIDITIDESNVDYDEDVFNETTLE